MDYRLDLSVHSDKVAKKVRRSLFIIRRLPKFASSQVLMKAYYGCSYLHMCYATAILGAENIRINGTFHLQRSN